ncbi:MAG: ABC transporter permease [Pyrinomonadaceae bacterium]|nr:ABC transporter permease [Phycisphaerales bacterium]
MSEPPASPDSPLAHASPAPLLRKPGEGGLAAWCRRNPSVWPALALLALLLYNIAFTPHFASVGFQNDRLFGSMIDILKNGSRVALLAVGMTLVIAGGGIDLSVGSVAALTGTVAALMLAKSGASPLTACASALGLALVFGLMNGLLVVKLRLQPIIATLVTLVLARGLAQTLSQDQSVSFNSPWFSSAFNGQFLALPMPIWIAGVVAVVVTGMLRWTAMGMYLSAVGVNASAARLCGIRVGSIRTLGYVATCLCAGIAGLVIASDVKNADPNSLGMYLELDAVLAVAIGGTSLTGGRPHVIGAVIGALLMQTITVMLQMRGVQTDATLILKAAATLGVCLLQSPAIGVKLRQMLTRRENT